VAFGYSPDGGVAGHLRDGFQVNGNEDGFAFHFGSSVSGFDSCMACADYDNSFHGG